MRTSVVARRVWLTQRRASITRETLPDGEIQYTVRISDKGRTKPFIEYSFATVEQAQSFMNRIRDESEVKVGAITPTAPEPPVVEEKDYVVIDVFCCVCGDKLTPAETEVELFRLGFPVHKESLKPECVATLSKRVKGE